MKQMERQISQKTDSERKRIRQNYQDAQAAIKNIAKSGTPARVLALQNEYKKIVKLPLSSKKYKRVFIEAR